MSTRCHVVVYDADQYVAIYRHSNGGLAGQFGVFETLKAAIPLAWKLPRFEAGDFAAAIVAAWKAGGGDIMITGVTATRREIERTFRRDVDYCYAVHMRRDGPRGVRLCVSHFRGRSLTGDRETAVLWAADSPPLQLAGRTRPVQI